MKEKLLWGILIFITVYMVIPWIITRLLGLGVFRKGEIRGQIAFTFDDGPDPNYTPQLLDMLAKHGVQATFFVLGSKAERNPDLIARIHSEGHQIGIHNYVHLSNWLMWPWTVKRRHVDQTAAIVERIIGIRPNMYRPPWGIINLFDLFLRKQYQIILWSVMVRDWNSQIGHKKLRDRLLRGITDGSIVLLHDSGDTFGADADAPKQMLLAIEDVLQEIKRRGLRCVRVDEMMTAKSASPFSSLSRSKRCLVAIWMLWERFIIFVFHIEAVDERNPLLRLRIRAYQGSQPIMLEDGECIRKGDLVAEIHLDNDQLFQLGALSRNTTHLAIQLIRGMQQLLPKVYLLLQTDPSFHNVKGLYGISLINRGPQQLGFTVLDLPKGLFAWITKWYLRMLLSIIHPQGAKRLDTKAGLLVPKIVVMSKKQLEKRYIA